ncbi:subtilisin-like protease SBT5.3 [Asparagus officinalis]|uniref:subtilisin-like protease SBT5.3 n=1 Tax=Asparagus officinalis TaxID=4686 RepID=UPI00098E642B|nr:subtilisin-like protease SBT5.3 [Asparagus officinalis]
MSYNIISTITLISDPIYLHYSHFSLTNFLTVSLPSPLFLRLIMAYWSSILYHLFLLSLVLDGARLCFSSEVYVVYMGSKNAENPDEILKQNHQMLTSLHGGSIEKAKASHVYSYSNGFKGFAAKLTREQASILAEMPNVVSVFPNEKRSLHTTRSWDFMGLQMDEAMEIPGFSTKNQENVIIGFVDTGIWPESLSFSDKWMPSVPPRWKGLCQIGENFTKSSCNKKVIGARYYLNGYQAEESKNPDKTVKFRSPRDSSGHGTHTASTASGRVVTKINYNHLGLGAARGGAPMARIAIYKACWDSGCYDADMLAAFDDAIGDGVDIISVSLGSNSPQRDYFSDSISVGSFHAASHGILVVASAGNVGTRGSVANLAPWILTVGASSTDREFVSSFVLGNRKKFMGESLSTFRMKSPARIISASEANNGLFTAYQSSFCLDGSLDRKKTRGKVVVCRHSGNPSESRVSKSLVVKRAGGVGMVLVDEAESDLAAPFAVPAAIVGRTIGERILSYVNSTRKPTSFISPARTVIGSRQAPRVAAFSSKGPNLLTAEILKPDIVAPGLNILAAWSPAVNKRLRFNILSGTSMSCPHVTGLLALIKAVYPSWSPAAIKSALMTTATVLDKEKNPITADPSGRIATPFDFGSGFPSPSKFLEPGLVYDIQPSDYRNFLCSIGYNDKTLQLVTGDRSKCTGLAPTASNLNYPSITVPNLKGRISVTRTLMNVGKPQCSYKALVVSPSGVNVTVAPKVLDFVRYGQKIRFTVSFNAADSLADYVFGSLTWKSGRFQVSSPLVVRFATDTGL